MAAISKQDYLKRYLSNSDGGKKKKRKKAPKTASKHPTSIIVDDDITVRDIRVQDSAQEMNEFEGDVDEAPAVYEDDGVTKISLETFKKREEDQRTKWAPISQDPQSLPGREVRDRLNNSDSDNSTPRMTNRNGQDTPDLSPRRGGSLYSPDQSPPRKKQVKSPPRRSVRDSSLIHDGRRDISLQADDRDPPRSRRKRHDSGDSHPERVRNDSPDLSPTRETRLQGSPDKSRVRRVRNDSPDLSPPHTGMNRDSDQSPPRKRTNNDSDQSPPRKRANSDSDQSPPRKQNRSEKATANESGKQRRKDDPEERMSSGRKAGLLSANDLKRESEKKREREAEMFSKMDPSVSGKGSETVYRDKMGRKKDVKLDRIKRREEERKEMEDNEKFMEWGRGMTQTKQTQEKVADYLHEAQKPIARYRDDEDLEKMLKDKERNDDPMLAYMKQKKTKQNIREGKKEKPVYKGPEPPPNRFNIRPGYRWDGVDRSNGFERKRFAMLSNKAAMQSQAYKWSTEDM